LATAALVTFRTWEMIMGMYKNWLIDIEELVWKAIEHGFTSEDEVYVFVFMHDSRVSRETVEHILQNIHEEIAA
jgi:hypothetical protein